MTAAPRQRFNDSTIQRTNLTLASRQRTRPVDTRLLRRIVHALLADLRQIEQVDLGICLVAASDMARLNETFLHHAGATDVIAFDYSAHATRHTPPASRLHGEIVICIDEAVSQARRFGTAWQSELVRYLIHGLLHLCGHDDSCPGSRRRMKREENHLLKIVSAQFPLRKLGGKTKLAL